MEIASSLNSKHGIVTLAEIIPFVLKLQMVEKLRLIRILAEQLDTEESVFPLVSNKIYDMPTPYNTFGAAEILMNTLETSDMDK